MVMNGRFQKAFIGAAMIVGASFYPGCMGTDVGNPQDVDVELEFAAFDELDRRALTLASGVTIDEAWFVFDRIELREAARCEDEGDIVSRAPIVANLVAPYQVLGATTFATTAGAYCRLELDLDDIAPSELPTGAPSMLAGHSVYVVGRRADGIAFELRARLGDRLRLDAQARPFTLEGAKAALELGFAANHWFDVSALDAIEAAEGPIRISDDENEEVFDGFREALKTSARLFRKGDRETSLADGTAQ
jgi:hypothetical protein